MERLDTLRQKVDQLYTAGNPAADAWIDWGYENHVLFVADMTERLAGRYGANLEQSVAGALLHDIADTVMPRRDPAHEAKSLELAGSILQQCGFTPDEVTFTVEQILKPHSCKDVLPTTVEGKVMATADGAAHFLTDFYPLFCWRHYGPEDDYQTFKIWMLAKIEKDFNRKLFFDEVKQEVLPRYEALKLIFA